MLLSGEVGMGKTTLVKSLLERLDSTAAVAYVFNTTLPFDQIFEYALENFGILKADHSPAQRLFAFNSFLAERGRAGLQTVLIVDEAQNLTPQTLEQIRLLSNFETATEKLLQIVLVGQTEIRSKLELPELRQLKQRIALRCEIPPLTGNETRDYIRTRLRIARAADLGLFTETGTRAHRRLHARDTPLDQHRVRSLPDDRLRRPATTDRPRHRGGGDRVPRGPSAATQGIPRSCAADPPPRREHRPRSGRAWSSRPARARCSIRVCWSTSVRRARRVGPDPPRSDAAMSKFFKALEQAERDRRLGRGIPTRRGAGDPAPRDAARCLPDPARRRSAARPGGRRIPAGDRQELARPAPPAAWPRRRRPPPTRR